MRALFIYRFRQLNREAQRPGRRAEPCSGRWRYSCVAYYSASSRLFAGGGGGRRYASAGAPPGTSCARAAGCVSATQRNARSARGSGGRTTAMLLPFSKMVSSFVTRRPSGVLSLRAGAPRQRPRSCAQAHTLGFVAQRARAARCGAALRGRALLGHVLEHHVDVHVEAAQRADQLLLPLHNHLKMRGKGAKRRINSSAALLGPPCTRIAATHAVLHGGARSSGRAARSARARSACHAAAPGGSRERTQMRLPTHLSTSSLGSRCDTLPPCCLVGSAMAADGRRIGVAVAGPPRSRRPRSRCHVAQTQAAPLQRA